MTISESGDTAVKGLDEYSFESSISEMTECADELREIEKRVQVLNFGSKGELSSAGPVAAKAHSGTTRLLMVIQEMYRIIDASVIHLNDIKDDFKEADASGSAG